MNKLTTFFAACSILFCMTIPRAFGQSNLLVNGNFELGDTGFSSGYTYSAGDIQPEGVYDVISNPYYDHPGASSFGDHTTGSGKMLAVNGSSNPSQIVWSETIIVATNTTYFLSGWGASWGHYSGDELDPNPAQLVFSVNGIQIGNPVQIPANNGVWQSFTTAWNSQSSTQAIIQIRDLNTGHDGNDFALDDLVFAALVTNSVNSTVIYRSVEINWNSTSNLVYQVQYSPSLPASNWFNLGNPITAVSTNTSAWDRVSSGTRFYRVLSF